MSIFELQGICLVIKSSLYIIVNLRLLFLAKRLFVDTVYYLYSYSSSFIWKYKQLYIVWYVEYSNIDSLLTMSHLGITAWKTKTIILMQR